MICKTRVHHTFEFVSPLFRLGYLFQYSLFLYLREHTDTRLQHLTALDKAAAPHSNRISGILWRIKDDNKRW